MPLFNTRLPILTLALCATVSSGCSSFSSWSFPTSPFSKTVDQKTDPHAWWEANKDRSVIVPGKGYMVEGTPGYFDASGRPIGDGGQQPSIAAVPVASPSPAGFSWPNFNPSAALESAKTVIGQGPNERRAKELFDEGQTRFRRQEFAGAAGKFESAVKRSTDPILMQQALFMQGESHFFADEYPEANDTYNLLFKDFPASRDLDKAIARQFAIGRYWQQHHQARPHLPITPNLLDKTRHYFDTQGHALKAFESVRLNDPTGPLADAALMATANTHFQQGRYEKADYNYGLLRREYPKSQHQFEAHLLGLQSKLLRYQGPSYDGTLLEEADKLVKQLLVQFPDQISTERPRIEKIRAEIAANRVLRDWTDAEYYAKRNQFGSARFYYQQIVSKYPDSPLATQSRERLSKYQNEPDVPPVKAAWLVNAFDSNSSSEKKIELASPPQESSIRR